MVNEPRERWVIGNNAIKIACLQVKAGFEFRVANELKEACNNQEGIINFVLMKGFGIYDIILLYEVSNFDFHLSKAGPIEGIIASTAFLCFPYLGSTNIKIFNDLKESTFVGLSFIKYKNQMGINNGKIPKQILNYFDSNNIKVQFLGTIGWNELVVLIYSENIQDISTSLLKFNYDEIDTFIDKITSTVAIKYSKLPDLSKLKIDNNFIKSIYKIQKSLINYSGLNKKIDSMARPTVTISSKPQFYNDISDYWIKSGFKVENTLGRYDIKIIVKQGITWRYFLSCLLYFRWNYKDFINTTSTSIEMHGSISKRKLSQIINNIGISFLFKNIKFLRCLQFFNFLQKPKIQFNTIENSNHKPFDFKISTIENLFGDSAAQLANHLYSLNGLLQDPLKSAAYNDMSDYPSSIINIGEKIKANRSHGLELEKDDTLESVCMKAAIVITSGARLRSYGIYGNTDLAHGVFSKLRGGIQLSLNAVEYIPAYILNRLNIFWNGFITVEDPKFSHIGEVISVPSDIFWKPELWWALYHETGHIILTRKDIVNKDDQEIKNILRNKKIPELYMESLIELAAEVIGFDLGFFDDFELYFETLLQHLLNIEPTQRKHVPMEFYFQRTFFVYIFSYIFRKKEVDDSYLSNEQFLFKSAIKHLLLAMKIINEYCSENPQLQIAYNIENINFLAARLTINMVHLKEFSLYLNKKIIKAEIDSGPFCPDDHRADENILKIYEMIKSGYVCGDEFRHIESLLYIITKERKNLDFKSKIASVLTFYNQTK